MIIGYDVANVNGPNFVFPQDAAFIFAKVSQDATFVDQEYTRFRTNARNLGIPFGGYHYGDPKEQPSAYESCDRFIDLLGEQLPGELGALDAEQDSGYGGYRPGDPANRPWTIAWGERFLAKKNYKAKLYIGKSALSEFDLVIPEIPELFDLWYAWWSGDSTPDNPPPAPPPFDVVGYKLWQYNADNIDKDAWLGTVEELRATGMPGGTPYAEYETKYWAPLYALMNELITEPTFGHANAALHAAITNNVTLHKIALGAESPT